MRAPEIAQDCASLLVLRCVAAVHVCDDHSGAHRGDGGGGGGFCGGISMRFGEVPYYIWDTPRE